MVALTYLPEINLNNKKAYYWLKNHEMYSVSTLDTDMCYIIVLLLKQDNAKPLSC